MSEPAPLPPDVLTDSPSMAAVVPQLAAHVPQTAGESTPTVFDTPVDLQATLEMIGQGLTVDANETTRTSARELWSRLSQLITSVPALSPTSVPQAAPVVSALPRSHSSPAGALTSMPAIPQPTAPITSAARVLRQLPPEQLLDVVLHRLRAALPAGTTVPSPKAIQFQLVPLPTPLPPR